VTSDKPLKKRRAEREHWKDVVDRELSTLTEQLLEAAGATKVSWIGVCPKCRLKVPVEFPDVRARTDAIKTLHELGYGKPRPEDEGGGSIILKRVIVAPTVEPGEVSPERPYAS
jgi:hypothetical protein